MTVTQKHQKQYEFIKERISCGLFHAAAVLEDGTVKAFGNNEAQQCETADWTDIIKVKCGPLRTVGLKKDGTAVSTKGDVFTGGRIPGEGIENFKDIVDIACGTFHTVGLKSDGTVIACGFNDNGQCDVENWKNVKRIFAENNHTLAICNDGSLLYCGENDGGSLNLKGISAASKLYCGSNDTVIVTNDKKVYRTDLNSETPVLLDISEEEIANVKFEVNYFIVLKNDGTVMHFGSANHGCDGVSDWTDILDIACSEKAAIGVTKSAICLTGTNNTRTIEMKGIAFYETSTGVSCFVSRNGKMSVLENGSGETCGEIQLFTAIPIDDSDVVRLDHAKETQRTVGSHKAGIAWDHMQKYGYLKKRLSGGIGHTVGVMHNNTVRACGGNGYGQCDVSNWTNVIAVACGSGSTLGLRTDGTVYFAGAVPFKPDCSPSGIHPSKWKDVKSICGSLHAYDHLAAVLNDGTVVAYGCNDDGQCNVAGWCDIDEISLQPALTAGVRKDGTVVVCGKDDLIKETVSKWTDIEHVYPGMGEQSLIGLKYDGTVVTTETDGRYDVSGWKDIIFITVGATCVAGLTGDGHLYFSGKNLPEVLNGISGVLCVSAEKDSIIIGKNNRTTDVIVLNKGDARRSTENVGAICFQSAFAQKMMVFEDGDVTTSVLFDEMEYGQDATDDWKVVITTDAPSSNSPGGCYVATCVYGSYDCPQVWTLRRFRDDTLGATWYGRLFIRIYYAISPTIVKWFGNTVWFKKLWKDKLDHMVEKLRAAGVEDTPYDDKNW